MANARKFELVNKTRDRVMLMNESGEVVLTLGDMRNTDDKLEEGVKRDERFFPAPVKEFTGAEIEAFGPFVNEQINEAVREKRIARRELVA